ncbi:MAG: DNA internalization-related competence protein ComEC/Rec2 [Burkholderiaceae bacterium]|nr:DNA internalization-related competence protein ComEC/Rec2 [Burkholderiales bacterium]MCZ8103147.1 DNA internalization-related competence protein ComEC/Rec2 [Burkholderiales bacterium]MCZ8339587.1 DNA internalization-related competence protein ComEC/Rec2 [Burkholderiaceae bacterium]
MGRSPFAFALAPVVVGAALVLQTAPTLPSPTARTAAWAVACGLVLLAWRAGARVPRLAALLALAALGAATWAGAAWRAVDRLDERLAPALEGVDLTLTGVVDELPIAAERGQRFALRVERCERGATRNDPVRAGDSPDAADGLEDRARGGGAAGATDTSEVPGSAPLDLDRPGAPTVPGSAVCRVPPRVSLTWSSGLGRRDAEPVPRVQPGERWTLRVRLRRPHAPVNPGAFDRELRWLEEGIGAVGRVRSGRRLDATVPGLALALERRRAAIRDALFDAAGATRARQAGVLAALAVGDQAAIDPALWTLFNATGIGHLMSVSGLHVTMVGALGGLAVGFAWRARVLAPLGLPGHVPTPVARGLAAVVVAFGYAGLAGWGVPAQRTCFMLATGALLLAGGRTASVVAAVGAAAAAIVALDPWAPLSAGFWLSFGAVVAIVWAGSGRRAHDRRLLEGMRDAVRTQWAASVALLPAGAWFFASASVVGPLANAFAIPMIGLVVTPLALAGGALGLVSTDAAAWLVAPAAVLLDGLVAALEALAALPGATVTVPSPGPVALAVGCAGVALLLAPAGVPGRALGALALLPLATAVPERPAPGELRLTALDVGQGMAAVVQVGERTLVYDTGPTLGPQVDAGGRTIAPWLRSIGARRVDLLVVSHQDDDHAGGARTLMRAVRVDALASSLPDDHPIVADAPVARRCVRGERWSWGDAEFEWLHPADPPEPVRRSPTNAVSCVLRVRHPAGTLLLAGDVEAPQERRLVELFGRDGLAADVLLVPHHGSTTSSSEPFVDAVGPRWAIVQAAYRSRFGHPHPRVVERYTRRGVELLRSDADGAVQLRLRAGAPTRVLRSRFEPARYWRVDARPP